MRTGSGSAFSPASGVKRTPYYARDGLTTRVEVIQINVICSNSSFTFTRNSLINEFIPSVICVSDSQRNDTAVISIGMEEGPLSTVSACYSRLISGKGYDNLHPLWYADIINVIIT